MDLLDTLTLYGTVVLAAPIGLLGIEFLFDGRSLLGVGFLFVAVALVVGQQLSPSLKGIVFGKASDVLTDEGDDGTYKD